MVLYAKISLAWVLYYALHSFLADNLSKQFAEKLGISTQTYRLFYVILSTTALLPLLYFTNSIHQTSSWMMKSAGLLLGIGAIFIAKSAFQYHSALAFVGLKTEINDVLITNGIYGYIRHPLYTATVMIGIAMVLWNPSFLWMLWNVITWIYLVVGIGLEEKKLRRYFGPAYEEYKRNTGSIVPHRMAWKKMIVRFGLK